jgi:hypothetical protein
MELKSHGRNILRQTVAAAGTSDPPKASSPSVSATSAGKVLLTFAEAGALIGVGERKAHEVLPTLVTPVVLGPRCVRIVRSELEAAVAKLPRRIAPTEPAQLLRGKIERLKRAATAPSGANANTTAKAGNAGGC